MELPLSCFRLPDELSSLASLTILSGDDFATSFSATFGITRSRHFPFGVAFGVNSGVAFGVAGDAGGAFLERIIVAAFTICCSCSSVKAINSSSVVSRCWQEIKK